ncbi:hypothetical protein Belba_1930 [Belliella baltica DSM 15883]|uniref:Outer membrane protein beta-barrel domain-containing protein n=1 Tax=Belliella baltica (strain DSM 15883 / CIP 108006 / LMG 21964 / BA134) TaxID=866536 RepID=I3Z5J4_BELBD|nr:hypothetical protein [Belliella baltica]AFL84512.1 hypothetical protein Belba_1930 [Belliella baltica DSM 15883]
MIKKIALFVFFALVISCSCVYAQSALRPTFAGIYHSGLVGQVGIGTDIEKKHFGELRFGATDVLEASFGIEGHFNRNIHQSDWFNFHAGLMLGVYFYDEARIGIPLGFTIKPIENHRNFAILMEATPNVFTMSSYFNLRANLGIRYTFRSRD